MQFGYSSKTSVETLAMMLGNKANTQRRTAYCFYCACQGRSYSQGHLSNALQRPTTSAPQDGSEASVISQRLPKLSTPSEKPADLHTLEEDGVRKRLQIGLGETTNLLESLYSTKHRKPSTQRAYKVWSSSLQTFDVRFHRGSQFLRSMPAVESSTAEESLALTSPADIDATKVKGKTEKAKRRLVKASNAAVFNVYQKAEPLEVKVKRPAVQNQQPLTLTQTQQSKMRLFHQQMSALIKLCAQRGELETARSMLNMSLVNNGSRFQWFSYKKLLDMQLPNLLIKAYSQQGEFKEAMTLYTACIEIGVVPNIQTYIWLLWAGLRSSHPKTNTAEVLDTMSRQSMLSQLSSAANHPSFRSYPALMSQLREEMMSLYPELDMEAYNRELHSKTMYSNVLVKDLNKPKVLSNPSAGVISPEKVTSLMDKHMAAELEGHVEIESILAVESSEELNNARSSYQSMVDGWRVTLTREFKDMLKTMDVDAKDDIHTLRWLNQFLHCMPMELFVSVMLKESERLCVMSEMYSPNISSLSADLGEAVRRKYFNYTKSFNSGEELASIHKSYIDIYNKECHPAIHRHLYEDVDEKLVLNRAADDIWPPAITGTLGEMLYKLIMKSLTVPADMLDEPSTKPILAFYTTIRWRNATSSKQVKPHPSIVRVVEKAQLRKLLMSVDTLPTVVPPVPWRDQHNGPLLLSNMQLVRAGRENYFGESSDEEILPVLDALNVLGSVPWRVNNSVYPLILQVFNSGGDSKLSIPIAVDKVVLSADSKETLSPEAADLLLKKSKSEAYSERMSFMLGLSVANHHKGVNFWLPHDVDFRGRAYPISRHLSQVSSDSLRSILTFAKGMPLGQRGLQWLKIHLVNMSGLKKRESNAARLAYAEEVLPLALQSAATPLEGEQWWQTLDSPWQGLAACMELKAAYDSGDPVNFLSSLPVHQDGSCNGLQHYSALGCDKLGASAVNVSPADVPHDTYQDVANIVEKLRAQDAANGHELARLLEGQITRKVVKQTVMTKVYGVTPYGSQLQIHKHLSAQSPDLGAANLQKASVYLANKLSESMASMFISSTEIQNWFTLCAHQLTTLTGKPVCWKTPLGLSVTQNYWTKATKSDRAKLAHFSLSDVRHDPSTEKPDVNQHKGAFPPNFIHSLDASHMMLTALRCHRAGVTFSSIHDCFWTHGRNVDTLNQICRESFYDLYNQPILDKLADYFVTNYVDQKDPEHKFMERVIRSVPAKGDLDLSVVKESEYFFS